MYKEIANVISNKLTMAYYRLLEYKKEEVLTETEVLTLNRMIAIGGIFRTILLKRLESSVDSFKISISNQITFLQKLNQYINNGYLLNKKTFNKYLLYADEELELTDLNDELEEFDKTKYRFDQLIIDINKDIDILTNVLGKVSTITPEKDAKLKALKKNLLKLSKDGQIIVFTYYADTLNYISKEIMSDPHFKHLKIEAISSSGATNKSSSQRIKIVDDFTNKKIDIILSTDVLSEGQNLQTAKYLINYDLHWNPTRMIQRAGRIDRIGSSYDEIFIYNFFPEDELEELLRLVHILQNKIIDFDTSIGLDQSVLGEEIHPKVFGAIKRIKNKDEDIFNELESDAFGGGEKFYQPLKDYINKTAKNELENIPYGVYSGLQRGKLKGVFFYYKYGDDFNFWNLYDLTSNKMIINRSEIIDFIACPPDEKRVIPDFFNSVYEINKKVIEYIVGVYDEIFCSKMQDTQVKIFDKSMQTKFIRDMLQEIESQVVEYMNDYPEDKSVLDSWEPIRKKISKIAPTKKRLQILRKIWRNYKQDSNWKEMIKQLGEFCIDKGILQKEILEKFDSKKLQLVTINFIS